MNNVSILRRSSHRLHARTSYDLQVALPINGIKDLRSIATVSTSGNVAMGNLIAKAFEKVNRVNDRERLLLRCMCVCI